MRVLAIDFGFKRIGIAVAETEFGVVTPRPALTATGTLRLDADNLETVIKQEAPELVLVGIPIEEDGTVGKMARVCQTVADLLVDKGISVRTIDERYSSVEAETNLRQDDLKASQRRKLRDGEAAGILLRRFMESGEEA